MVRSVIPKQKSQAQQLHLLTLPIQSIIYIEYNKGKHLKVTKLTKNLNQKQNPIEMDKHTGSTSFQIIKKHLNWFTKLKVLR